MFSFLVTVVTLIQNFIHCLYFRAFNESKVLNKETRIHFLELV